LVRRAVKAGYKGIFVTVDSVRFGSREADARNGGDSRPPPHRLVNYDELGEESSLAGTYNGKEHKSWDQNSEQMWEQNVTWDDIRWLKREGCRNPDGDEPRTLPLVVKGVMTAEDALLAVDAGADGVMVSNHGGRGLDGCLAAIDALPEVVAAVGGRVPVLMDGGVTRGTDVLKAVALGATAVGLGKPVFFALACGGEEAVVKMLGMLKTETEAAMAICGCRSIEDVTSNLVTRHPSGGPMVPYIRSSL
jgi:isopentenyl diphosphate isomerase/L-lactate dehydrogenase-like FMN-dependent dehydrogenase